MCLVKKKKKKDWEGKLFSGIVLGINIFVDALLDSNLTIQIKYWIDLIIIIIEI